MLLAAGLVVGATTAIAIERRAYSIDVRPQQGDIAQSAAFYVLDRAGDERAGYLFPFSSRGVEAAVRALETKLAQ
jgi:hypothetical protein